MTRQDEPIEDFLDELLCQLRLPPRAIRRSLVETESHLRECAADFEAQGMERVQAERRAIEHFGTVGDLARAEGQVHRASPVRLLIAGGQALLLLVSVALLAIGVSGAIAALFNGVSGPHFVGALPDAYSATACRHYLQLHEAATSCGQAASWEASQDAVVLRLLAGGAGAVGLFVALLWRRLAPPQARLQALDGVTAAIAAMAFACAALFMAGQTLDIAVQHGSGGVGWWLSGALAAALAAVPCAVISYRHTRSALRRGFFVLSE